MREKVDVDFSWILLKLLHRYSCFHGFSLRILSFKLIEFKLCEFLVNRKDFRLAFRCRFEKLLPYFELESRVHIGK